MQAKVLKTHAAEYLVGSQQTLNYNAEGLAKKQLALQRNDTSKESESPYRKLDPCAVNQYKPLISRNRFAVSARPRSVLGKALENVVLKAIWRHRKSATYQRYILAASLVEKTKSSHGNADEPTCALLRDIPKRMYGQAVQGNEKTCSRVS
eukprot:6182681-Pleurochrysis_carterae.AAC.2